MQTSFYEIGVVCRKDAEYAAPFLEDLFEKTVPSGIRASMSEDGIFVESGCIKPFLERYERAKVVMWEEAHIHVREPRLFVPEEHAILKYLNKNSRQFKATTIADINLHRSRIIPMTEEGLTDRYVDVTEILSRFYDHPEKLSEIVSLAKDVCGVDLRKKYELKPNDQKAPRKQKRRLDGYRGVMMGEDGKVEHLDLVGEIAEWLPSYIKTSYPSESEIRNGLRGHSI